MDFDKSLQIAYTSEYDDALFFIVQTQKKNRTALINYKNDLYDLKGQINFHHHGSETAGRIYYNPKQSETESLVQTVVEIN